MMRHVSVVCTAAALVVALALPAAAADVHVGINIGVPPPPPVVFAAPPNLVAVPGAPQVLYAPEASVSFFAYGSRYYTYDNGNWFIASTVGGPWTYVERAHVPHAVLVVPPRYYRGGYHHAEYHGHHHHGHEEHHEHGHPGHGHGHGHDDD